MSLVITSNGDCDGDGVTNEQEGLDGTDPSNPCDLVIANQDTIPTNVWLASDCDSDGLSNEEEMTGVDSPLTSEDPNGNVTDPLNPDTDGDGVLDGVEAFNGTDPNNPCDYLDGSITLPQRGDWNTADCDGDGVTNEQEVLDGTIPTDPCDLIVASQTTTPDSTWLANDCDNDGLTNEEETTGVDDPLTPDTPNGEITDPLNPDTDGDGVTDGTEGTDGTNPNAPCDYESINVTETQGGNWNSADCDGDGVTNEQEVLDGTIPTDPCDLIVANQTTTPDSTWLANDCDNDGLTNEEETTGIDDPSTPTNPNGNVTDPLNPDTDGDGVTDGIEAVDGTNPNDPCDVILANQDTTPSNEWDAIDCDNDGLTNGEETTGVDNPLTPTNPNGNITDPLDADTDGDGVLDGTEAVDGTDPNDPCSFVDASITVVVTATAPCQLLIPEGFSPNGDGVNDYFVIEGLDNYEKVKVIIMNRWGNKVYESSVYQNDWDGTNKFGVSVGGDQLPVSTYFYIIDLGEGEDVRKGYVYLNR